ncbi:MAG TPA: hypothetical protein PKO06_10960, partial [Candidatus Ozemobacteraceae bacterium]|nr:hypothetical protein [Candidatus Ozemobacteraceae bacterium]
MKHPCVHPRLGLARLAVILCVTVLVIAALVSGYWWLTSKRRVPRPPEPPKPPVSVATASVLVASPSRPIVPATHPVTVRPPVSVWPEPEVVAATREAGG